MPVQRATTSAMSSAVTSSLRNCGRPSLEASLLSASASCLCNWGMRPYEISAALARSPRRLACSASTFAWSISCLILPTAPNVSFSRCHWAFIAEDFSFSSASSRSICSRRSTALRSFSFCNAVRSISSCMMRRSTSSISWGIESISMRNRDAASSTRSMALSGRNRSPM